MQTLGWQTGAVQDLRVVLVLALEVTFKIPVSGKSLCQALRGNVGKLSKLQNLIILKTTGIFLGTLPP